MKKYILFLFLFFLPFPVFALVNYDVDAVYIDANLLENGDMHVKEILAISGTFHGYIRDLAYRNSLLRENEKIDFSNDAIYNGSGIQDVVIKAKKTKMIPNFSMLEDSDFENLTKAFYVEDAVNKNYVESSLQDGKSYRMYYEGTNETVLFYLEYTITDVVVEHEDVAELYWTFIGDSFDDDIGKVIIHVTLPKIDVSDQFLIWAHGDLTGSINKLSDQVIEAKISRLRARSPIDIRTTFSKDLVVASKQTQEVALPQILEVEESRAVEAEETREQAKLIHFVLTYVSIGYIVVLLGWWIYVYFRFDKEYKSDFQLKYNREFIDRYNVEVVDVLMNQRVTENAFAASVLNLIYKKNITVTEIPSEKKKKKEYEFTLNHMTGLNDTEEVLVHFLFDRVGKNQKFTTIDLRKYASQVSTYENFNRYYTDWVHCVKKDADRQNFYETNGLPIITSLFGLLIAIFIFFATLYFSQNNLWVGIAFVLGILFFIYSLLIKKRSREGNEDYVRWKAFKQFLLDFGHFETKELPEIALWERYLVYATVFGIADQVEKSMAVKLPTMSSEDMVNYNLNWVDFHIAHEISSQIAHSFEMYHSTYSSEVARSASSSGSGFGGGFSSGGGFGGGGGGGRGF